MNSERKAFIEAAKKIGINTAMMDTPVGLKFKYGSTNDAFKIWQASAQREGYKLVPVDTLERTIGHISIAMCHPNNTRNEEDIMHNDMVIIEKAMIGAVDE